jgi:hypothetical protein
MSVRRALAGLRSRAETLRLAHHRTVDPFNPERGRDHRMTVPLIRDLSAARA